MSESRKGFKFIWKIKDFSFSFFRGDCRSPYFFIPGMDDIIWYLSLRPNSYISYTDNIYCYLFRGKDSGPKELEIDYELSFLAGDSSVLQSETFLNKVYTKNSMDMHSEFGAKRDDVFLFKKDIFTTNDTFIIRCRMWGSQKSTSLSRMCVAITRIGTESRTAVGTIKKFSCLEQGRKYPVCDISSSSDYYRFSINLSFDIDGLLYTEIKPLADAVNYYRCKIFIQDKLRNYLEVGQGEFYDRIPHCIPFTFSKNYLIKNKDCFLWDDKLIIFCELVIPQSPDFHVLEFTSDYENSQEKMSNTMKMVSVSEEHLVESSTTLKDDWISLFRESILCDTKLKTATDTFPAHIAVLSARSPVFKSMFTTDMKEKTNNCVDIDDLDADTVRKMLLFMYSDTLDDLEYESAKNLYFAADKYDIVSLRHRCSKFLKQSLLQTNCCDILILANTHQDQDLKIAVQNYISENDKTVLFSEEWKNLEKNHSQMTTEVFRFIYLKKLRS